MAGSGPRDDPAGPSEPRRDHMGVSGPHRPVRRPQASGRPLRRARPRDPGSPPGAGLWLPRRQYLSRSSPADEAPGPEIGALAGGETAAGAERDGEVSPARGSIEPPDPLYPARLREFRLRLPSARAPPNGLLALPEDRLLYLAALLRDAPTPPPALSPEEWQDFLDLLRPHSVYPLLVYRLRTWPEDCRPPKDVTS